MLTVVGFVMGKAPGTTRVGRSERFVASMTANVCLLAARRLRPQRRGGRNAESTMGPIATTIANGGASNVRRALE